MIEAAQAVALVVFLAAAYWGCFHLFVLTPRDEDGRK